MGFGVEIGVEVGHVLSPPDVVVFTVVTHICTLIPYVSCVCMMYVSHCMMQWIALRHKVMTFKSDGTEAKSCIEK
jgi:hypothetical protein